jgi:hypothetical protein
MKRDNETNVDSEPKVMVDPNVSVPPSNATNASNAEGQESRSAEPKETTHSEGTSGAPTLPADNAKDTPNILESAIPKAIQSESLPTNALIPPVFPIFQDQTFLLGPGPH